MKQILARWQKLPSAHKFFLVFLLISVLSPLLPWFGDRNQFTSGNILLGVSGPIAFIGLNILVFSAFVLLHEFYFLIRNQLILGEETALKFYRFLGPVNLYLVIIAASVYFHPSIGTNLLAKSFYIGFYSAVISSLGLFAGFGIKTVELVKTQRKSLFSNAKRKVDVNQELERDSDVDQLLDEKNSPTALERQQLLQSKNYKNNKQDLTIEDVLPENIKINKNLRAQWEKQKNLEKKVDNSSAN